MDQITAAPTTPLNGIPRTMRHDEGAIARCSYCGRYSLDPATLSDRQPVCDCGKQHGWCGSFVRPDADSRWSGKAPTAGLPEWLAYDASCDIVTSNGVKYSGALFRELAQTLPVGALFRIESRDHGVLDVRRVDAEDSDQVQQAYYYRHLTRCAQGQGFDGITSALSELDRLRGSAAARDVLAERRRQVEQEGWTPEHDDKHGRFSMSYAAACYALADSPAVRTETIDIVKIWQWSGWSYLAWWKPKDRRSNLVRAGALILAEIERLDRASVASIKGDQK